MRRRAFVAGGLLVAAAPRIALARAEGDAGVMEAAVELEQLAAYVYDAGVKSGLLDERLAAAIAGLRDHEQQHADAMATSLEALGGGRPPAPATPDQADAALQRAGLGVSLRGLTGATELLELALGLEERQVDLYTRAVAELEDVRLIQTCGSVAAAEGQHLVVIRRALERDPVPSPFETGRP